MSTPFSDETRDSDDDEWVDSNSLPEKHVEGVAWNALATVECSNKDHKYYHDLRSALVLQNFDVDVVGQLVIHRCEPLKDAGGTKRYPTVTLPDNFQAFDKVLLTMTLFHPNSGHVYVRFPNLKDKVEQCRTSSGLWVKPSDGPFRMKKKALDKGTKQDVAFHLGGDFKFHVPGIEPCFAIVATPLEHGQLAMDKAIRSPPFMVHSKRQYDGTTPSKRRKKNKEVTKLKTDIAAAHSEKETLQQEDMRMSYVNTEHQRFMRRFKNNLTTLPEGPAKIALMYATRPVRTDEPVAL